MLFLSLAERRTSVGHPCLASLNPLALYDEMALNARNGGL